MSKTKNSSAYAEFILNNKGEVNTHVVPIIKANHRKGIKTLVVHKATEDAKLHVMCIGVKMPEGSGKDGPVVETIELKAGQSLDMSNYEVADMDPVGLDFGAMKRQKQDKK